MIPSAWIWCSAAVAVALLGVAAFRDARERHIPNGISLGVALSAVPMLAAVPAAEAGLGICFSILVFGGGAWVFSRGLVGGGDVKLGAAAMLWCGPALLSLFLLLFGVFTLLVAGLVRSGLLIPDGMDVAKDMPLAVAIAPAATLVIACRLLLYLFPV